MIELIQEEKYRFFYMLGPGEFFKFVDTATPRKEPVCVKLESGGWTSLRTGYVCEAHSRWNHMKVEQPDPEWVTAYQKLWLSKESK